LLEAVRHGSDAGCCMIMESDIKSHRLHCSQPTCCPACAAAASSSDGGAAAVVTVRGAGPAPRQFYTKRLAADTALIPTLLAAGVEFGVLRQGMTSALVRCSGRQPAAALVCMCVVPDCQHIPLRLPPPATDCPCCPGH
jgi:hypothetical protein